MVAEGSWFRLVWAGSAGATVAGTGGYRLAMAALGTLTGAASCISLIQNAIDVGLIESFARFLAFYREIIHTALTPLRAIADFINWRMPAHYADLFVLSCVGTGYLSRGIVLMAESLVKESNQEGHHADDSMGCAGCAAILIWPFTAPTLLGLFVFLMPLTALYDWDGWGVEMRGPLFRMMGATLAAIVVFYAINFAAV